MASTTSETEPLPKPSMGNPAHLLAFGFGAGCSPKAPGTMGTLLAIGIYLPLSRLSLTAYLLVLAAVILVGIGLCEKASRDLGVHDHPGIVWDEIAGFLLTMVAAPPAWQWIVAGFLLFRLFDIWKPWPIRWCDKNIEGGFGIMFDDVVAGIFACVALHALRTVLAG
jgi:phosphatidylglycerophosphatase A